MTKRSNTKEFIEKATTEHGVRYRYDRVSYTKNSDKVEIYCYEHGYFMQTPAAHLAGKGCAECGDRFLLAKKEFTNKAKKIHGDIYDYSLVDYQGSYINVDIICTEHGKFSITPSNHLNGGGCQCCAYENMAKNQTKTQEEFIKDFKEVHGDRYDISQIQYIDSYNKIRVGCYEHSYFEALPNSCLQGSGCPSCGGGYSKSKPGTLYILSDNDLTKVGITNKDAVERCAFINKDSELNFSVVYDKKWQNGSIAKSIEFQILKHLRKNYKRCDKKFNGSTEVFYGVSTSDILLMIKELENKE